MFKRFSCFPYLPPLTESDPVPTATYAQQNVVTNTSTHTVQTQHGVNVSVSAGIKTPFTASLKVTGSLQWTNTGSVAATTASSQTASMTVGGPAFGYKGPTNVLV
jgi:hypothetical protein